MASQRIPITTSAGPLASGLQNAINQLADARNRLQSMAAYAQQAGDGGGDVAAFAAAFGISGADAQAAYNLLAGAAAGLFAPGDLDNLIDRAGTQ